MKTVQQLYAEAKSVITEVPARDVHERMARGEPTVLIDIREQNEVNLGYPEGAILIGRGILEREVESRVPRDAHVVLICANGNRSALAARVLGEMGYADVSSLSGGFREWIEIGGAVAD